MAYRRDTCEKYGDWSLTLGCEVARAAQGGVTLGSGRIYRMFCHLVLQSIIYLLSFAPVINNNVLLRKFSVSQTDLPIRELAWMGDCR